MMTPGKCSGKLQRSVWQGFGRDADQHLLKLGELWREGREKIENGFEEWPAIGEEMKS